jgi:CRISPR-associated protein Cmr3
MRLFIEPVDVWLFRDGRPFLAGSDHRAQSLFPPYPSVMQGVIRSHHLVVHNIDLTDRQAIEKAVGTATDYRNLRLRGPFVARRENGQVVRYFPVPADAVWRGDQVQPLAPQDKTNEGIRSSAPTPLLLWDTGEPEKPKGNRWLSQPDLENYLSGKSVIPLAGEELFLRENRLGIGLDDATRTTRRVGGGGLLYEVAFIRVCDGVGLEVEVQGLDGWPTAGVMRMGGEGRAGRFGPSNAPAWSPPQKPLSQRFKIYFATPTLFEEGWQPKNWNKFFKGDVKLVAAALGRYQSVGGFDWAKGAHKSAHRYVPAGSVYFFECPDQAELAPDLTNEAITDDGAEIGFGQIIIGRW